MNKSYEELLSDLQNIKHEYSLLKASYNELFARNKQLEFDIFKSKETIDNTESHFREFIERAPVAIGLFNIDGIGMYANQKYLEILGLKSDDEFIGRPAYEYFVPRFREESKERIRRRQQGLPVPLEYESIALRADGSEFPCHLAVASIQMAGGVISIAFLMDITEQKQLYGELIAAKEKAEENERSIQEIKFNYETFFNTIDELLFVLDMEGNIIYFNKTVEDFLGFTHDELIGKSVLSLHPEDRRNEAAQIVKDTVDGKNNFCSVPILTKKGSLLPVETFVKHGVWNGKPALFCVTKDITKLKLSEEKFSKVFFLSQSACGLSEIETGNYIEVNDAFTKLFGFTREEAIGHSSTELRIIPEKTKEYVLSKADSSGRFFNIEAELRAKNGEIKKVLLSADNIQIHNIVYRYTVVHDITEIIKAKENSEENEKKYKSLFSNMMNAFGLHEMVFNEKGEPIDYIFLEVNPIWEKVVGIKADAVIGKKIKEIMPNIEKGWLDTYGRIVTTGIPEEFIEYNTATQKYYNVFAYKHIGNKFATVFNDVTEKKQFELELIKAKEKAEESDRLKTAFIQNLSHEIRTPMNAILGFAELLPYNFNNKAKLENFSSIINQRCADLLDIINDLLDISKIESGQLTSHFEQCNIAKLFSEITSFFKEHQGRLNKNHIAFEMISRCEFNNLAIVTDSVKLKQIFINLLINAFKFTEKGKVEAGCLAINTNELIFYVSDTGIGIPADKHQFIFERFSQIDSKGTRLRGGNGLGLAIVKGLVSLLGGRVWLESELGKGTTFYFSIDYKKHVSFSTDVQELDYLGNSNILVDKTVLIVEDDTYNMSLLNEILSSTGLKLICAVNASDAIQKANKYLPDLILMDIGLPDMNGYDATRIILSKNTTLKVVAQTAYASSSDKTEALKAGCIDHISKPIKEKLLLALLTKHLS